MTLFRARSLPGLLSLTVVAGSLTGVGLASPAFAEGAAPSAAYALDFTSLWAGQSVTLTESDLADDDTAPAELTREVTWGDGSPVATLPADGSTLTHTYAVTGEFAVTVKITDKSANVADGTFPTTNTVKVTTVPGAFKIASKTLYWGESVDIRNEKTAKHIQVAKVSVSGLTADVTKATIDWGDGKTGRVDAKTAAVNHTYKFGVDRSYPVSVTLSNSAGGVGPRSLGSVKVVEDTFNPKGAITTPKNKTKVSSWKTITGTASDKGLGVDQVAAFLVQKRGKSWYYYTGKTWRKASSLAKAQNKTALLLATISSGKWSVKIKGLKKGKLVVGVLVTDKNLARGSARGTNAVWTEKAQTLTK